MTQLRIRCDADSRQWAFSDLDECADDMPASNRERVNARAPFVFSPFHCQGPPLAQENAERSSRALRLALAKPRGLR